MIRLFVQFKFRLIQIHFLYTVHGRKYSTSKQLLQSILQPIYSYYMPHLYSIYYHSTLLPKPLPSLYHFGNHHTNWNAYFFMYKIVVVEWEQKEDVFIKQQMILAIDKCNQIIFNLMKLH